MKPSDQQHEQALDLLREEAAAWLLRPEVLHCRDNGEFKQWLATSPQHQRAWEEVQLTWQLLGDTPPHYERLTSPRAASVPNLPRALERIHRRAVWRVSGGRLFAGGILIATLCLAAVFTVPSLMIGWQADYRTSVAETRAVRLEDGSIVQLGAQSAIKTNFAGGRREVAILAGEAFFDVVHDATRPFIVDTRDLKVEVLGTVFDVRLGEEATEVALARGVVRASALLRDTVKSELLSPGERLRIDRRSGDISIEKVPPEDIGAWRSGRLFVVNSSISAAVEEIQRYHPAWIMVPDRTLANTRVTGIYDLSDPDRALTALVSPFGGRVRAIPGLGRVVTR
jgi:transmembrane sensor